MTIDRDRILASKPIIVPYRYSRRDTMLHALAVGIGMDPLDRNQLRFVYDNELTTFPTLSAILGWIDVARDRRYLDPRWGIDGDRVVVGEIEIQSFRPLPPEGQGYARISFAEIIDKGPGRGALLRVRKEIVQPENIVAATMDTWLFVRGGGGFGGPRDGGPAPVNLPQGAPDAVCDLPTPPNLALLYRLSLGDHNAVHADPRFAAATGFERPILHGIANFSIAVHAVLRTMLGYEPTVYRAGKARMSNPVFPGDTLRTEMWRCAGRVLFRTSALERNVVVMSGGKIDIAPQPAVTETSTA